MDGSTLASVESGILARGIFTSVADLKRKITKYIRHHNKVATPVRWTYSDAPHCLDRCTSIVYGPLVGAIQSGLKSPLRHHL